MIKSKLYTERDFTLDGRNMLKSKNNGGGLRIDFFLKLFAHNCLNAEEILCDVCSVTNLLIARRG